VNLFATVLTYPAPAANYRGESELNRTVIQKVTDGRFDYPIISPEAMRNALREALAGYGLPCNRERLHDEEQLAVRFKDYPNPARYADDFFFGYFVAAGSDDRRRMKEAIIENEADGRGQELRPELRRLKQERDRVKEGPGDEEEVKRRVKKLQDQINKLLDGFTGFAFKRDSVLRMNLAKALEPYRFNAVFTQSPLAAAGSAYQNDTKSALLHRETCVTAFQYPFALNGNDCKAQPKWTRDLLRAIGELNDVAGNHARSYFEMAPASVVVRLTDSLVAGYATYGFAADGNFPEVIEGIVHDRDGDRPQGDPDYPGGEFYLGGKIIKDMPDNRQEKLRDRGVTLERDPRKLLRVVADKLLGG
jgi:CRISPR-associated protein Cst2